MVPDKIYIPTEYTDNDIIPVGVTLQQVFPNDVCYIRKDALLKWLEYAETIYNMRGANAFELLTLQMIIEHINEM